MRRLTYGLVMGALPIILVMIAVRLVMSPFWLQYEYTRPGFPIDPFGFTTEDRLTFGRYAVDYLIYLHDISHLGTLRFQDGRPLYNERELIHMRDVQVLTRWAFVTAAAAGLLCLVALGFIQRRDGSAAAARALAYGAGATIALLGVIVLTALIGWEYFFTGFHELFFADGTWYFLTSDTLIRLFPEQFWFDTAIAVGGLTILQAGLILALTWVFISRAKAQRSL